MAGAHKEMEHAEHLEHISGQNRKIALLIAVIALFLAFSETLGKSAQTAAISDNVEASNLWAFFQAKTIRMTTLTTAAETRKIDAEAIADTAIKASMGKQIEPGRKPRRATTTSPKPAKVASNSPPAHWRPRKSATTRWPSTIITRWRPPRSRSESCWPPRP